MFAMPDAPGLAALAATLGINLPQDEAALYLPVMRDALRELDQFVQSRTEETAPPLLFLARPRGFRPSLSNDPLRAWLWKCDFGGADSGLLAGKAVSFKDHISVAASRRCSPLAVPCGKVGKLPISLQLIGRHLQDGLLLRVAHAYQQAVDWAAFTGVG